MTFKTNFILFLLSLTFFTSFSYLFINNYALAQKTDQKILDFFKEAGISTFQDGENEPQPWMLKIAQWSMIVFSGAFFTAILLGGTLYAIMPQGNQWKDNGLKMIQGAIISAVLALGSGLLWGILKLFFS